jgi:hypothetical protein
MPSGKIAAHSGENFSVLLPQHARDCAKQCINFTARQQRLELNYSIRGPVRLERSEPSIVNAEIRRNQAEGVETGPASLFTRTDLPENFTCGHELIDSFGPHMNHGPAIVGHLQQIEAESPKYARLLLCELNYI